MRRRGHSCLLVERARDTPARVGETLPPAACRPLAALGVWDSFVASAHLPSVAIHSAWGSGEIHEREFIYDPYGNGWHLDRARFDAMLLTQASAAGAQLRRPARLLDAELGTNGVWTLRIEAEVVHASFVVDASGRAAAFARRLGAKRSKRDRLLGVVARYRPRTRQRAEAGVMLLEAAEHGWWYAAPLPDDEMVMSYMTDPDLHVRGGRGFEAAMAHTEHAARYVQGYALAGPLRPAPADSACLRPVCGAQWLAVGDAAASYDPLSGQGIVKALANGLRAAQAISAQLGGDASTLRDYEAQVAADFERAMALRQAYYAHEARWPESPFWHRRHSERN